jgi:hypothetical protein
VTQPQHPTATPNSIADKRQTPLEKKPKRVRWNGATIIEFTVNEHPGAAKTNRYLHNYFKTQKDHQLHDVMIHIQSIATHSKQILKGHQADWHKKHIGKTRPQVEYTFPAMANVPSMINNHISPEVARSQRKLTTFKVFHHLIQECTSLALE